MNWITDTAAIVLRPNSAKAAEVRWTLINHQNRVAGCRCGRPSTRVTYSHGQLGNVPPETWTCEDHVGVSMWCGVGHQPLIPYWEHTEPCPEGDFGLTTKANGDKTWHCPHKSHP